MSRTVSLWPSNLVPSDRRMPEDILREQAQALVLATGGLLEGLVEPGSHGEWLTFNFSLVVPRLDNYSYRLFKVRHKVPDPFNPLEIIVAAKDVRKISDEATFQRELAAILGSQATRSVVGELLALARNASPPADADDAFVRGS